jgi:dipeptidase E
MKTILLTSAGMNMRDEIVKILPKPAGQIKLAHITTASKVEEDISYVENERAIMIELGLQVEEIDIEGKGENELREMLADKDVIYVQGGNTFFLLKCVCESGFDKVVKELIEKSVIYIGVSAGSIIAGPTIETAGWKGTDGDSNDVGIEDFSGMNLVDFNVFVHYQEKYREAVESESQTSKYPVKTLTNDQAVLVRDGEVKFIEK